MKIVVNIVVSVLFVVLSTALAAQNNVVSNAIQAFHEADYQKTYELCADALVNIDELSGDYIPAAYYYLAKSRIQVLRQAIESDDQEKLSGMQNALIESYYDYKEALKTADSKLKSDIKQDLSSLYNPILQTGLSALNTSKDLNQPYNVREAALNAALGYLKAARDINTTYLVSDLLGQAHLAAGDTATAAMEFEVSIKAYLARSSGDPDFLMAYVYFRKAMIERYFRKDNNKALVTLIEGQNVLNTEYSRQLTGSTSTKAKKAYDNGLIDLIGFELDIYLKDTIVTDDAIIRFQEILVLYPEDYDIHVSYANLMEKVDANLAIDAYETAISIDETKELAYFNLGALYNNLGSEYYLEGLNHDDEAMAEKLFNEANTCFRKAYLYMEEAYGINPRFLPTIRALVQLANTLGLDEKVEFYKSKELELRGF